MYTPEILAYAAGFFDGEGCVNFAVSRYRRHGELRGKAISLRVMIGNTDLEVLQWFVATFGGRIDKKPRHSSKNARPCWVWSATFKEALPFLQAIRPYSRVKSSQIDLVLEFSAWRLQPVETRCYKLPGGRGTWKRTPESLAKEAEYKTRLHELNRRGIADSHDNDAGAKAS